MKLTRRTLLATALAAATPPAAMAQSYPNRLIKVILPYTAGSPNDVIVRVMLPALSARLGQSVIVENRPGGGTLIGTKAVAAAEPDGHTLLAISINFLMGPTLSPGSYDPFKDFTPVGMLGHSPFILVVPPSLPVATIQEFVAHAKAHPGQLNFGFGQGTAPHLIGEMFKAVSGADIASIPYKGGAPAIAEMLGGRIHMNVGTPATLLPLIREGKVKALAVTGASRSTDLPRVPTMAEAGLPSLTFSYWIGLVAPARTPAAAVARLNTDIAESLKAPELRANLARIGIEPQPMTLAAFGAFMADEKQRWEHVLKTTGVRLE